MRSPTGLAGALAIAALVAACQTAPGASGPAGGSAGTSASVSGATTSATAPTASTPRTTTALPTPQLTAHPGATIAAIPYADASPAQVLDLHLPTTPGPWPVAVFVHGGSWMVGGREMPEGTGYGALRQTLTEHGIAVAAVDYRLVPAARFPAQLSDVKAALRFLRAHAGELGLDGTRVYAIGDSAGGHLALLAALTSGDPALEGDQGPAGDSSVRAAVSLYGVTDLQRLDADRGASGCPTGGALTLAVEGLLGGDPAGGAREAARAASPVTYAALTNVPLLLLHGTSDCLVPADQSRRLADARRAAGRPVTLRLLDAGHIDPAFYAPDVLAQIVAFLDAAGA